MQLKKIAGYTINMIIIIYFLIDILHLNSSYIETIKHVLNNILVIALGLFIYVNYKEDKGTNNIFSYFNYFMIILYIFMLLSLFGSN